jgi:hypothetical protein
LWQHVNKASTLERFVVRLSNLLPKVKHVQLLATCRKHGFLSPEVVYLSPATSNFLKAATDLLLATGDLLPKYWQLFAHVDGLLVALYM